MYRLRWWLVSGAGIPWSLRIGTRVSSTHPTGQRACRRPANFIVGGHLLQQDFAPLAPNRCWAGDITYIRTTAGWRYLAIWIDLYSRRVVGWAMGASMEATLVLEALNRAIGHRQIELDQLLIHTDQGGQYRAMAYRRLLESHKISCSKSSQGLLLGQRSGGELFLHPQTRTGPR
ncbi:DDE-type integrase/transposase/recombinase [Cyanobium sp. L1E-Cus]|uniref:DDE-type integrase/transposase/recombinase n=1 Tax=Cyanobium sp. L1E-Cus TaxID=2823714 RepID=UPI0020CC3568|nr:DDE-type integrase/transposase/recombinase [Cyanobium sp. L1E-Cus]MCP9823254.1 DDE-type integrase/transposase/recombinase [Cyanobium sp. L1E-Cus]